MDEGGIGMCHITRVIGKWSDGSMGSRVKEKGSHVDFATGGPSSVHAIHWEHPNCWPQPITGGETSETRYCVYPVEEQGYIPSWKFCLDFYLAVANVVRVLCADPRTLYRGDDDFLARIRTDGACG